MSTVSAALVILYYRMRNSLKEFTLEYKIEGEEDCSLQLRIDHHKCFWIEKTGGREKDAVKKKGELPAVEFKKLKRLVQQSNLLRLKKKSAVSGKPFLYSFHITSKGKENRIFLSGQPDKTYSKSFIKLNDYLRTLSENLTTSL